MVAETKSWEENAKVISKLLSDANLPNPDDVYVSFEYAAPVGGRVDCVLFGTGKDTSVRDNELYLKAL